VAELEGILKNDAKFSPVQLITVSMAKEMTERTQIIQQADTFFREQRRPNSFNLQRHLPQQLDMIATDVIDMIFKGFSHKLKQVFKGAVEVM